MPKFSIITVVYNDLAGLKRTVSSVRCQDFKDYEHVIIDGASSDGSRAYLSELSASCRSMRFVSERDRGIYDAMNKGASLAQGDWAVFLNAGDRFANAQVLTRVGHAAETPDMIYFGRAQIMASNTRQWIFPPGFITPQTCQYWLGRNLPNHQAIFFPRIFYKHEAYSLALKISADSEYKERALTARPWVFLDLVVCEFYLDGLSSSRNFSDQMTQLKNRYARFSAPRKYFDLLFSFGKACMRWFSYKIFGRSSFYFIHVFKSAQDYLIVSILSLRNK